MCPEIFIIFVLKNTVSCDNEVDKKKTKRTILRTILKEKNEKVFIATLYSIQRTGMGYATTNSTL